MADFQIAPYRGDQYIAQGFQSAAQMIAQAREEAARRNMQAMQLQQMHDQFLRQQTMEQKRVDLGYYTNDQTNARDYYGMGLHEQELKDNRDARSQSRADALQEKKDEAESKYDPKRVQPVQMMDPATGQAIPNYYAIPMTGQVFQPKGDGTAPPAMGSDPTGTGNFYFDGKSLKPNPAGSRLPSSAVPMVTAELQNMGTNNATLQGLQAEIAQHQAAIATGDNRYGFLNMHSRQDRIKDLQTQQQQILQSNADSQAKINAIKANLGGAGGAGGPVQPPALPPGPAVPAVPTPAPTATPVAPAPSAALVPPLPQGPGQAPPTIPLIPNPGAEWPAPATAGNPMWPIGNGAGPDLNAGQPPPAKPLDRLTAARILQQAGGDRNKARAMARAAGYTF